MCIGKRTNQTAVYHCEHCGTLWDDAARYRAIKRGEWRATNPFVGTAGFRLSGLCSPWTPLESAVRDFLQGKKTARDFACLGQYLSWRNVGR